MSYNTRDSLNVINIANTNGIGTVREIEKDIIKICQQNGMNLKTAGLIIGGGGRHTGNGAVPGHEHILNRLYQHIAGIRVDKEHRQYHRENTVAILKQIQEEQPDLM